MYNIILYIKNNTNKTGKYIINKNEAYYYNTICIKHT